MSAPAPLSHLFFISHMASLLRGCSAALRECDGVSMRLRVCSSGWLGGNDNVRVLKRRLVSLIFSLPKDDERSCRVAEGEYHERKYLMIAILSTLSYYRHWIERDTGAGDVVNVRHCDTLAARRQHPTASACPARGYVSASPHGDVHCDGQC